MTIRLFAIALALALVPTAAVAQATELICTFNRGGVVTDLDETPTPEPSQDAPLMLVFRDIDFNAKTARLIGNTDPEGAPVIAILGVNAFSFVEVTPSGNVNTTTVFPQGRNAAARAVTSRHVIFGGGTPIISQLFGTCRR